MIDPKTLTSEQRDMLTYLGKGMSNRDIARLMLIHKKTAEVRMCELYRVLGVSNRVEAAVDACRMGLL